MHAATCQTLGARCRVGNSKPFPLAVHGMPEDSGPQLLPSVGTKFNRDEQFKSYHVGQVLICWW